MYGHRFVGFHIKSFKKGRLRRMLIWHGFNYGWDQDRKEWYAVNTKTGERFTFASYSEANWFVENNRA